MNVSMTENVVHVLAKNAIPLLALTKCKTGIGHFSLFLRIRGTGILCNMAASQAGI